MISTYNSIKKIVFQTQNAQKADFIGKVLEIKNFQTA
jgi:hypothetical protein